MDSLSAKRIQSEFSGLLLSGISGEERLSNYLKNNYLGKRFEYFEDLNDSPSDTFLPKKNFMALWTLSNYQDYNFLMYKRDILKPLFESYNRTSEKLIKFEGGKRVYIRNIKYLTQIVSYSHDNRIHFMFEKKDIFQKTNLYPIESPSGESELIKNVSKKILFIIDIKNSDDKEVKEAFNFIKSKKLTDLLQPVSYKKYHDTLTRFIEEIKGGEIEKSKSYNYIKERLNSSSLYDVLNSRIILISIAYPIFKVINLLYKFLRAEDYNFKDIKKLSSNIVIVEEETVTLLSNRSKESNVIKNLKYYKDSIIKYSDISSELKTLFGTNYKYYNSRIESSNQYSQENLSKFEYLEIVSHLYYKIITHFTSKEKSILEGFKFTWGTDLVSIFYGINYLEKKIYKLKGTNDVYYFKDQYIVNELFFIISNYMNERNVLFTNEVLEKVFPKSYMFYTFYILSFENQNELHKFANGKSTLGSNVRIEYMIDIGTRKKKVIHPYPSENFRKENEFSSDINGVIELNDPDKQNEYGFEFYTNRSDLSRFLYVKEYEFKIDLKNILVSYTEKNGLLDPHKRQLQFSLFERFVSNHKLFSNQKRMEMLELLIDYIEYSDEDLIESIVKLSYVSNGYINFSENKIFLKNPEIWIKKDNESLVEYKNVSKSELLSVIPSNDFTRSYTSTYNQFYNDNREIILSNLGFKETNKDSTTYIRQSLVYEKEKVDPVIKIISNVKKYGKEYKLFGKEMDDFINSAILDEKIPSSKNFGQEILNLSKKWKWII